jgi:hypothetical protein
MASTAAAAAAVAATRWVVTHGVGEAKWLSGSSDDDDVEAQRYKIDVLGVPAATSGTTATAPAGAGTISEPFRDPPVSAVAAVDAKPRRSAASACLES